MADGWNCKLHQRNLVAFAVCVKGKNRMKCKCIDCGRLGLREQKGERQLREAEKTWRDTGDFSAVPMLHSAYRTAPECGLNMLKFSHVPEEIREQINQDRECPEYIKWRPGRTPREHDEMKLLEETEKINKRYRDEDREEARKNREADNARQSAFEARVEASGRRQFRINAVIQIATALLAAGVALYVAFFTDGQKSQPTLPPQPAQSPAAPPILP